MKRKTPSYAGLRPSSGKASKAARASSRKRGTRCEKVLRAALKREGLRFTTNPKGLSGRPDIVFPAAHVAVFCDGDFWHGRHLKDRISKLERGHNAAYWLAKITANVRRDRRSSRQLRAAGWTVLRLWETDILRRPESIVRRVARWVRARAPEGKPPSRPLAAQ